MRTRIAVAMLVAGALLAAGAIAAQGKGREDRPLFATLTGKKEVNQDTGKKNAGDPDGRGSATVLVDGTKLCFAILVKNLDAPAAAHIHRGQPDENGPVVQALTAPSSGDPGASGACIDVTSSLARQVLKNPSRYYVNVHTAAFPRGAIRGQLSRR